MKERRVLLFAIATVLVIAAVAGVFWYLSTADDRAARDVDLVQALVATAPIPAGTTGQVAIDNGWIDFENREAGSIPDDIIRDPEGIALLSAAAPISAKQFITTTNFVEPERVTEGGPLVSQIAQDGDPEPSNRQAVSITLDPEKLVDGNVQPGDIINIVALATREDGTTVAFYLLYDVPVIGRPATGDQAAAEATGSLIVSLPPEEILRMLAARQSGMTLWTTLVPRDYDFSSVDPVNAPALIP